MRGPTFYQLHLLLDKHAGEQLALIDLLAERVQTLGGVAVGDPRHVAEITRVPRAPDGCEEVPAMLSRLLEAHELILIDAHDAAARVAERGDDGTNDLLVSGLIRTGETAGLVPGRAPGRHPAGPSLRAGAGAEGTPACPNSATAVAAEQPTPEDLLFQPYRLGPYDLPHRIVMAPLTRSRARQPGNVPGPLNACYYAQRASAALIISEATQVSMQGQGYAWTPGIHSREQVEGWRLVTEAVHRAGGLIFNQLWHVGRISHPALQPDQMLPVAPSAIRPRGEAFIENENGEGQLVPFVTPRALQIEEMPYLSASTGAGRRTRWPRASMASRCTAPMAISWSSSSLPAPTAAATPTAARSRTGRGC